jgi:hypothetical protein
MEIIRHPDIKRTAAVGDNIDPIFLRGHELLHPKIDRIERTPCEVHRSSIGYGVLRLRKNFTS